jgi:hypothetical protein
VFSATASVAQDQPFNVTTYHYNNLRTGWNDRETVLTTANVSSRFGVLFSVPLDDQVDAQPLLVTGQPIDGKGMHDVVYVATGSNTIYAIDATNGAVLLSKNLGKAVSYRALPFGCNNNGPNVGITSTPVIDLKTRTMYVIAYTQKSDSTLAYYVHKLDLQNLADQVPAREVSASHRLTDGSTFNFDASVQRQRPGLVMANDNIYAGFGSFCDLMDSRGWLLGWKARSLEPLPATQLNNRVVSTDGRRLSSIWMSGYGIAADASGDLFFSTGNSDNTYNPPDNVQESVVRISSDLTTILDYFTPYNYQKLDQIDLDLGAGGVLLLPDQPGPIPHLAATAGKGYLDENFPFLPHSPVYLLNRDNLGKYVAGGADRVVDTVDAGGFCWCGPSYFRGADGAGRLVTSGGRHVIVWKVQTSSTVTLVQASKSEELSSGPQPGFFTTVSSNSTAAETAIIWAVARPTTPHGGSVTLYAINAENGLTLYANSAGTWGTWRGGNANANIVPVVANGRVYVASDKELKVFGTVAAPPMDTAGPPNQVFGVVIKVEGSEITLQTRTGRQVRVDPTAAENAHLSAGVRLGGAIQVRGTIDSRGVMRAEGILRARNSPAFWEADY